MNLICRVLGCFFVALLFMAQVAVGDMSDCVEPGKYWPHIERACNNFGINPNLVLAVIRQESNCDQAVCSTANACGLMQLIGPTARAMGVRRTDAAENIWGGVKYLRYIYDEHNLATECQTDQQRLKRLLCSYNAGPGRCGCDLVPPFKETRNYVKNVPRLLRNYGGGGIFLMTQTPRFGQDPEPVIHSIEYRAGDDAIVRVGQQFGFVVEVLNKGADSPGGQIVLTLNRNQFTDQIFNAKWRPITALKRGQFLKITIPVDTLKRDNRAEKIIYLMPKAPGEITIKARFELRRAGGRLTGSVSYPYFSGGFLDTDKLPSKSYPLSVHQPVVSPGKQDGIKRQYE